MANKMGTIGFKLNNSSNNNNMDGSNIKWIDTKGGKIGLWIGGGIVALVTTVLLIRHFRRKKGEEKTEKFKLVPVQEPVQSELYPPEEGCGMIVYSFDRTFNYVKCGEVWHVISKDMVKIPNWKPLSNKTAINLLNNKYPS